MISTLEETQLNNSIEKWIRFRNKVLMIVGCFLSINMIAICVLVALIFRNTREENLDTVTSKTNSIVSTTSAVTVTFSPNTGLLSHSGVQRNLNISSLSSDWSLCHSSTYVTILDLSTITEILRICYQDKLLLGCRLSGSSVLTVAAMGKRSDVLYDCGTQPYCTHYANDVGWYFSAEWSWGFVDSLLIPSRVPCDNFTELAEYRLCWPTSNSFIGSRCGTMNFMNTDTSYERVIFHAS